MEIFRLFGSILVDSKEADKSIAKTEKNAEGLGSKLGGMIGTAAKWGAGLAAGGAVAVGGMVALVNKTAAVADEIDKLSERTGINREELQRWKYAAGQSGADVGKLEVGIKKLSDVMDQATSGNENAKDAFKQLGITMDDLKNKSQEDIFSEVMASLADMEQGATRNALGNDLLGKSFTEMLPLLNAGSQGMQDLKTRADELGIVMSEEAVKANVKFGDTLSDVQQTLGAVFMQVSNAVLPVFQTFLDWVLVYTPQIKATFEFTFTAISFIISTLVDWIGKVVEWSKQWVNDNQSTLNNILSKFREVFNAIIEFIKSFIAWTSAIWEEYGDELTTYWKAIWNLVATIIDVALTTIANAFKIWAAIFRGDWSQAWFYLKQYFSDIWDGIKAIINAAINVISSALNGLFEVAKNWGKHIVEGLWNGISSMKDWIKGKITDFADNISSSFKDFFGIQSPSKLMQEYGEYISEGLAKGIEEKSPKAIAAIQAMSDSIKSTVENSKTVVDDWLTKTTAAVEQYGNYKGDLQELSYKKNYKGKASFDEWKKGVSDYAKYIAESKGVDLSTAQLMAESGLNNPTDDLTAPMPELANGGVIDQAGRVLVGERGPEILDLPRNAKVTPLDKTPSVSFGRGAFEGAVILDDYGVDRLMDRIMDRLSGLGVRA